MRNRVFFPQTALDHWLHDSVIDLTENEMVVRGEGRKYRIVEAVRVMAELSGGQDVYELVGKVKTIAYLTELGAELLDTSMMIGELAYDVIPGFVGSPIGSFAEHRAASGSSSAPDSGPQSDEELLSRYLIQNLE